MNLYYVTTSNWLHFMSLNELFSLSQQHNTFTRKEFSFLDDKWKLDSKFLFLIHYNDLTISSMSMSLTVGSVKGNVT